MYYFKTKYRQFIFNLSANSNPLFIGFFKYLYRPKKGSLSHFLDLHSKSTTSFTVIQVGANDGITHDPIHKFIKRDHWQGVLLEPQKEVFNHYLSKIYQHDKGIKTVNAALGPEDGVQPIYKIGFSSARWATGLTSFNRATLEKAFTSGHVARQAAKENIAIPKRNEDQIIEEQIDVISTSTLLERYAIEKIDLLQIDAEGYDFEIIKLFNFELLKPRAIIYEHMHLSDTDKELCESYLGNNMYTIKHYGGNTLATLG